MKYTNREFFETLVVFILIIFLFSGVGVGIAAIITELLRTK